MQLQGIVLKRFFPMQKKIELFDAHRGVVYMYFTELALAERLWPGMQIQYQYVEKRLYQYFTSIDIIFTPVFPCYESFKTFDRLLQLSSLCLQKKLPDRKNYSILSSAIFFFSYDSYFFLEIEKWLCALMLQDAGFWDKKFFIVINTFFMKLSILIDSFIEQEVELFREWLCIINKEYDQLLEKWIESCMHEHRGYRY